MMPKIELLPVVIDIETTGLDSLEHEILAIGIKWGRKENCEKVFCRDKDTSEFSVIYKTLITLGQFLSPAIVGYNITNFDIPFIAARATKLGMDASIIRRLPRVDLMDVVSRYILTNKRRVSLAEICDYYGIERDSEFRGSLMPIFWENGEYHKIITHLQRDLRAEWALFERLEKYCAHNLKTRYKWDGEVRWIW